jgi:type IV pilus assembly protein PilM
MAFSLRKHSSNGSIGLDIDGRFIAAAQTDGQRIVRTASVELPEGVVRDGEVTDPHGLGQAVKSFVTDNALPRTVRLGVSNQQIVVRVIELPLIQDEKQRDAAVRFQAAETIAMPLDEAVLDYQVAAQVQAPDGSSRMQVVVVAARRSMVDALVAATKAAGLKAAGIDLDAFALVRVLGDDAGDDNARVYCHLAGVTNLAVAVGSSCFFTRPLGTRWDEQDAASSLADEIRLSIDYYMTQPQAKAVAEVVLSGPGSAHQGWAEELAKQLGLPVTVANPLGRLDTSPLPDAEDASRYTIAAGLALGAAA